MKQNTLILMKQAKEVDSMEYESPYACKFTGTLKKIQLYSNRMSLGPMPEADDIIEQHLTINNLGQVWLSYYVFGEGYGKYRLFQIKRFKLKREVTNRFMDSFTDSFKNYQTQALATDVGDWNLTLTNTVGATFKVTGSLIRSDNDVTAILSDMIRDVLDQHDLFAFDGGEYYEDDS